MQRAWIRGVGIALVLGTGAVGQDEGARGQDFGPFLEVPGNVEFTGAMIATPRATAAGEVDRAAVLQALSPYVIKEHSPGADRYVFLIGEGQTENEVAERLRDTGLFEHAHPDWRCFPASNPNDARYGQQWQHGSTRMNSSRAWNLHTGRAPVAVTICDSGVRITHEDLRMHRLEGYNSVDRLWERSGGQITQKGSHGTEVTGCAAANGDNLFGVVGAGWNLRFRMNRVTNVNDGSANLSDLIDAAEKGIEAGDKVANVSYSGINSGSVRSSAQYIWNLGGLLVWSIGNDGKRMNWGDRDNDKLMAVGATDPNDTKASYSNFGQSLDLVAPGTGIWTTTSASDNAYTNPSGTSFAAPLVAGLAALLWSADPTLSPAQVNDYLKLGCDDLGASGPDDTFGYGRIDSFNSMQLVNSVRPGYRALVSWKNNAMVKSGIDVQDEDVVLFDLDTKTFSMYFDGSDVLTTDPDLDAITLMPNGDLLMSFEATTTVPGIGTVEDEDIVQFTPTSLGASTAGTFTLYFDGSDVQLDTVGGEDINGISLNGDNNLLFTVVGKMDAQGVIARNEDVVLFVDTSLGPNTAGSFVLYFDGSDADALLNGKGEQMDAYHFHAGENEHSFSSVTSFSSPVSVNGLDEDFGRFVVYASGKRTAGWMVYEFDAIDLGLGKEDVDALYIFP